MKGFEVGQSAVVAPIASSYATITVLLSVVIGGEALELIRIAAIALMVLGVILVSGGISAFLTGSLGGAREALTAMVFFGLAFFAAGFGSKALPGIVAFCIAAFSQSIIFLFVSWLMGAKIRRLSSTSRSTVGIFSFHAILLNGAWVAFLFGTSIGNVSIVVPVSSMFAGITALLGISLMRERLVVSQYFGLGLILLGSFLLAFDCATFNRRNRWCTVADAGRHLVPEAGHRQGSASCGTHLDARC